MHPQVVIFVLGPFARMTCCKKRHDFASNASCSNKTLVLFRMVVTACLGRSRKRAGPLAKMTGHDPVRPLSP